MAGTTAAQARDGRPAGREDVVTTLQDHYIQKREDVNKGAAGLERLLPSY